MSSTFSFVFCKAIAYPLNELKVSKLASPSKRPYVRLSSPVISRRRLEIKPPYNRLSRKFVGFKRPLPKLFNFTNTTNTLTTKLLLEFKLKATQFFKQDLNRTIINYNIKGVYTPKKFMRFNSFRSLPNYNYLYRKSSFLDKPLRQLQKARSVKTFRRVPMFWVSKITQKTLTPLRRDFNILSRKQIKYQHRLTQYLLNYYKFKVLELVNLSEFALGGVLLRSKLLPTYNLLHLFLSKEFVTVNGLTVKNRNFVLGKADVLQLALQLKVFLFLRWNMLIAFQQTRRFFFYLRK